MVRQDNVAHNLGQYSGRLLHSLFPGNFGVVVDLVCLFAGDSPTSFLSRGGVQ